MLGASLINALFARDIRPLETAAESMHRFWEAEGPLTAFEAYDLAERLAMRLDVDAVCMSIASEGAVDSTGRALGWTLGFHLPVRRAAAAYCVRALTYDDGEVRRGVDVDEAVTPISPAAAAREVVPLPVPFRDSPEVMTYLDHPLTCGESTYAMRSSIDPHGRFVWMIDGLPIDDPPSIPLAA